MKELGSEDGKPVINKPVMGPIEDSLPDTSGINRKTNLNRIKNLVPTPAAPIPKPGPLYRVRQPIVD